MPRAQVVQAAQVLAPVPALRIQVLVPAQARAQVLALHPAVPALHPVVPAQVHTLPLQAVPALAPAHLQVAPALVQAQVLAQAPHLHTAPVPAHLRANPTVTTKNMTHTDQ